MEDSSIGLLRELFERRIADAEANTFRLVEELRAGINVLTERVAELTIAASPAAEPEAEAEAEAEEHAPEPGTPAALEDDQLADELEEGGASDELVEEVLDIKDEIASEYEEETRPERMFWLHRPVGFPFRR